MVLDTSALVAILFDEPDAEHFEIAIESDPTRLMSTASVLEASIVVEARLGEAGGRELDLLVHKAQIEVVAVTVEQLEMARHAFRTYGKGRHKRRHVVLLTDLESCLRRMRVPARWEKDG